MAVFSLLVMLISAKDGFFYTVQGFVEEKIYGAGSIVPRLIMLGVALVFFILSLMFLFADTRKEKDKKGVSRNTNIGCIKISLNAIESIALNAAKRIPGIKETKVVVKKQDDNVLIEVKNIVLHGINIPTMSEEVQAAVKSAVEEYAGVEVKAINVVVNSISEETAVQKT